MIEGSDPTPSCSTADHAADPLSLDEKTLERASRLLRAVSDLARLRLLVRLSHGEACVTELAAAEGETLSTISQRLRILRSEQVVVRHRRGKHIDYALADQHVALLVRSILEHAQETL